MVLLCYTAAVLKSASYFEVLTLTNQRGIRHNILVALYKICAKNAVLRYKGRN
jgi:hypothetical protein